MPNMEDARDEFLREYDRSFAAMADSIARIAEALAAMDAGKREQALDLLRMATSEDWSELTDAEITEEAAEETTYLEAKLDAYDPDGAWAEEYEARKDEEAYIHMIQVESLHW